MTQDMTADLKKESCKVTDEGEGVDWDSFREIQPGDEMNALDYSRLQQFSHQLAVLDQQRLDLLENLRAQCFVGQQSSSSLAMLRFAMALYQQR